MLQLGQPKAFKLRIFSPYASFFESAIEDIYMELCPIKFDGGIAMSEDIVDKVLVVISVGVVTELATGDLMYQVTFGVHTKITPEILSRVPANAREPFLASKSLAINEMLLLMKVNEVPYKVGSQWKMKINKNGTLNLVEAK